MKVRKAGRLPPPRITTHDLGVDTQWAAWRCPVQCKWVITFQQSMKRVRSLGPPANSWMLDEVDDLVTELVEGGLNLVDLAASEGIGNGTHNAN
eukprot:4282721-Amphidinium_carterae.1